MSRPAVPESNRLALLAGALPAMPQTAARVLELVNDPRCGAEQMGRVIGADPALAGAVLRLANSALFGLTQPVASISQAIVLIGFLRLRSLMLATLAAGLKNMVPAHAAGARDRAWEHSAGTAVASRAIAQRIGLGWHEEAFAAGLLHDCGRLVLLTQRAAEYRDLMDRAATRLPTPDEEFEALGIDHPEVGGALLRHWKQAAQLCEVAERHHEEHADTPHGQLVDVVVLADRLLDDDDIAPAARRLGIPFEEQDAVRDEVLEQVASERAALLAL